MICQEETEPVWASAQRPEGAWLLCRKGNFRKKHRPEARYGGGFRRVSAIGNLWLTTAGTFFKRKKMR